MNDHEQHKRIESALERLHEAHFWLHQIEHYYHQADPFRWHLNSFLKAIDEVPQLLQMALQNDLSVKKWLKTERKRLEANPLMAQLRKHRNFVVHRGMLVPHSTASIGVTELRGLKLGLTIPLDPLQDSDDAMRRYLWATRDEKDFLGILAEDEDSLPCVERVWRLPTFEDEVIDVCAAAWLEVGQLITETLWKLGTRDPRFSLNCRHSSQQVQFKLYKRETLRGWLSDMKAEPANIQPKGA